MRMAEEAYRTAPRHALAGILQALRAELTQALAAAAEAAAAEIRGRQQAAISAKAGKPSPPARADIESEGPARPEMSGQGRSNLFAVSR